MLTDRLEQLFHRQNLSEELRPIIDAYDALALRRESACKLVPAEDYGELDHVEAKGLAFRQALLHRSVQLFERAMSAAAEENVYSMALSIRGHFETTASLGYFHQRLSSLRKGNISAETLDCDLTTQLLGVGLKTIAQAPNPKNILPMLEYADKLVCTVVMRGSTRQYNILKDSYEFLCEFAHPNFHSNAVAIDIDKSSSEFRFRHEQPMGDREFGLIRYLLLSAPIFVDLFDQLPDLLSPKNCC